MAGLEAVLKISARDDAGPALVKVKDQIAALDKQIAVFDKMSAAVSKITRVTDPMISSIDASTRALAGQRGAVAELAEGAEVAAGAQRTLGEAITSTTRMMVAQGVEAVKVAGKIVASQKTAAKGAARASEGGGGGIGIGAGAAAVGEVLSPVTPSHLPKGWEEGVDVERFTAELPDLAAGRPTLFDELVRLAKPETELTVSEFADLYRVVSPESGARLRRAARPAFEHGHRGEAHARRINPNPELISPPTFATARPWRASGSQGEAICPICCI
jgi:hypothetical protein